MDRRRDGVARQRWTSLDMKSHHRKMIHAHPRVGAWTASCWREAAIDGACGAIFWRGSHRLVDRPRVPRNLRFPAGEELAGKSLATATATATARRSDDGGFREENIMTGMKHDHRKSKLGFPFGSNTM